MSISDRFNNLSDGDTLEQFEWFLIAPMRNDRSQAEMNGDPEGTCFVPCEPGEAEIWSIYGALPDFEFLPVHDETEPREIVRIAAQILHETGKPFNYRDEKYGLARREPTTDLGELVDDLAGIIWHDIEEKIDKGRREDDFENHELAPLHEAFADYSDYGGAGSALNPYEKADRSVTETHGMCCPKCKRDDEIDVSVAAWARLTRDGSDFDLADDGAQEFDDDSLAKCCNCGFAGTVADFKVEKE